MYARNEGEGANEERTELGGKLEDKRAMRAEADLRVAEIEDGMLGRRREYDEVYAKL